MRILKSMPRRSFITLFALLIFGCNYEPGGTFFKEIAKPTLDGITLDLNNFSDAVIQLKQPTTFTYVVNPNGKQVIDTRVLLDGAVISSNSSLSSSFTLNPENISTGSHPLRIEVL